MTGKEGGERQSGMPFLPGNMSRWLVIGREVLKTVCHWLVTDDELDDVITRLSQSAPSDALTTDRGRLCSFSRKEKKFGEMVVAGATTFVAGFPPRYAKDKMNSLFSKWSAMSLPWFIRNLLISSCSSKTRVSSTWEPPHFRVENRNTMFSSNFFTKWCKETSKQTK